MSATEKLLDEAKTRLGVDSDYALSRALEWDHSVISNYRRGKRQMDVAQCLEFSEKTGIALEEVAKASVSDKKAKRAQTTINFSKAA